MRRKKELFWFGFPIGEPDHLHLYGKVTTNPQYVDFPSCSHVVLENAILYTPDMGPQDRPWSNQLYCKFPVSEIAQVWVVLMDETLIVGETS